METTAPSETALLIGSIIQRWPAVPQDDETHPEVRWEVRTVFDHDYNFHILVQQWRWNGEHFARAGYSLWYVLDVNEVLFVDEWPKADRAPQISAAAHVMKWEALCRELSEQRYGGHSDDI